MIDIIVTVENTTRNARKTKYYTCTHGDGSVSQLTTDVYGRIYRDGAEITGTEEIKQAREAIARAIRPGCLVAGR